MALAAFQGTAVDNSGNVIPFANVEVRLDAPGRPAQPIFADFEGTDPIGTTFQADEDGKFRFHAPGGFYWIRSYEGPSQSPDREHILRYQAIGTAAARDIEALAAELETGIAPFATKEALDDFTPSEQTVGAKVLNDPDPTLNGFYIWDSVEEVWEWERPLFDTLARLNVTGGTANDIAASLSPSVDSAHVVMLFIEIAQTNTGPVTINGLDVLTVDNDPLIAGHLIEGRTYFLTDEGDHFRLRNETDVSGLVSTAEAAAAAALQSEDNAASSESNAEDSADRAEAAATSVENPVSYAPQSLDAGEQAQARKNIGADLSVPGAVAISELASGVLPLTTDLGRYITLTGHGSADFTIEGFGDACPVGWTVTLYIPRTIANTGGTAYAIGNWVRFIHTNSGAGLNLTMASRWVNGSISYTYEAYPDACDSNGDRAALIEALTFFHEGGGRWRLDRLPEPFTSGADSGTGNYVARRDALGNQEVTVGGAESRSSSGVLTTVVGLPLNFTAAKSITAASAALNATAATVSANNSFSVTVSGDSEVSVNIDRSTAGNTSFRATVVGRWK